MKNLPVQNNGVFVCLFQPIGYNAPMTETTWHGLDIEGTVTIEAPTGPSYACGGEPGGAYVEDVFILGVDCSDTFEESEILESCGLSYGAARMVYAWARMSGTLPGEAARMIENKYDEEISESLVESYHDWE